MRPVSANALSALSAASALGYLIVSKQVAGRQTRREDRRLRGKLQKHRHPIGDVVANATNPLGKEWFHLPAAAALSLYIHWRRSGRGAYVPALASALAESMSRSLDRLPPHRRPPSGHPDRDKPSFPSGHALETTAVAGAGAYVLAREGLADAKVAFGAAAALSLASTLGRLYLDRHWLSDALGGTALGLSIAAGCAALYGSRLPQP